MSGIVRLGLKWLVLTGLVYVLIGYPLIKNFQSPPRKSAQPHKLDCPCGCEGDLKKCGCKKLSGLVGFRFCETQAESPLPMFSSWLTEKWNEDSEIVRNCQSNLRIVLISKPLLKEVIRKIEHPPQNFPPI